MKVKVSYTMALEDVPGLLENLLSEVRKGLGEQIRALETPRANADLFSLVIDEVRERLAVIDSKLEDCVALNNGYSEATSTVPSPPPMPESVTGEGPSAQNESSSG